MRTRGANWQAAVLDVLVKRAKPTSAYDVLEELRDTNPKIAPPTVYRALSALQDRGRIHRLESLNSYMACSHADHSHSAILSICDDCGTVEESVEPDLVSKLTSALGKIGFEAQRHVIEVHGTCASCGREEEAT